MRLQIIAFLIGCLVAILAMGSILKKAEAAQMKNIQTYSQPELPINIELIETISSFIVSK